MNGDRTSKQWLAAAPYLLGGAAAALVTLASFWLGHRAGATGLEYTLLPALLSLAIGAALAAALRTAAAAAAALRASERQWREVFEHNPVMYFMVDAAGTVLSVNAFGAAQLGYTVGELVGQPVLKVFPEEERDYAQANVAASLARLGQASSWEIRKVRKDGSLLWVRENAKAVRSAAGPLIILIACEDITERKRTEDALRQSQMYLAEGQRVSHTGSFGWKVARGDIVWSDETYRIFECDPAQPPTLDMALSRTHPDDRARLQRQLRHVSDTAQDWEFEYRLLMPGGTVKHLRVVAHAVHDAWGELEFIGAVMDISAIRQAEEALHQSRAELARVARVMTLGELAAAIAHEVNQPLAGLVSSGHACLRWLSAAPPNLEAGRRSVERMLRDGMRAGEVVQRIQALVAKAPPRRDWLNMNAAISEVIALVRTELQRNHITLQTELSEALPLIRGDRIQLQQIILNLVMNAIEAMSGAGQPARILSICSRQDGAHGILVAVRDTGPGLNHGAPERVFDAFYSTKQEGMGMGLAISRTIAESHGGKLSAASGQPRGALFELRLPTVDGEELAAGNQAHAARP